MCIDKVPMQDALGRNVLCHTKRKKVVVHAGDFLGTFNTRDERVMQFVETAVSDLKIKLVYGCRE